VKKGEFITVSVRPEVEVLRGELRPGELKKLRAWIELNREVLVQFWDGEIEDTIEVLGRLKPVEGK
jgi:hypothetical protein